jgi:5-methylcytosine-specific restriction protein A
MGAGRGVAHRQAVVTPSVCSTPGCPNLNPCLEHKPKPWANSQRKQRIGKSGWQQQADAKRVLRRDHHRCAMCGVLATEVDHVIPLAEGGTDTDANKQSLCHPHHAEKTKREAARGRTRARG